MTPNIVNRAQRALTRPAYAKRFAACQAVFFCYGFVMEAFKPGFMQPGTFETFLALTILVNGIVGYFFVSFTYRRALDCEFGKNGKARIAMLAALPTVLIPNLAFIVFAVMMFFKSAPEDEEATDIVNDTGMLRPLEAGE